MTDAQMEMDRAQEASDLLMGTTLAGEDVMEAQAEDDLAALEAEMAQEQAAAGGGVATGTTAAPVATTTGAGTTSTHTAASPAPATAATPAPAPAEVSAAAAAALPSAPSHTVTTEEQVDAELAALQAEMA